MIGRRKERLVLDLERYSPFFITALSNSLASSASRSYRRLFGIGVGEWRLMTMLANHKGLALQVVACTTGVDKSAVSRSENVLSRLGYTSRTPDPADARRKLISLTPAGRALYVRVLEVALAREALLLKTLSEEERQILLSLLRRLLANLPAVNGYEPAAR